MSEPPQWVQEWVGVCAEALGLVDWDIRIALRRTIDDDDRYGKACVQYEYEDADIYLRDTIEDDRAGRTLVMHEMLHLANQHREMASRLLIGMIPEAQQDTAKDIWTNGKELDIVHLSRALTNALQPKPTAPTPDGGDVV
jgi:hypothetical protein